jgi:hypothetical protein
MPSLKLDTTQLRFPVRVHDYLIQATSQPDGWPLFYPLHRAMPDLLDGLM